MRRTLALIGALVAALLLSGLIAVPGTTGSLRVAHPYDRPTAALPNARFADGGQIAKPEAEMLGRRRAISTDDLSPTVFDQNFYTHELREMVRYRRLGCRSGQPPGEAGYTLWNNVHTATLEDYGLTDADLFFPGVRP